MSEHAMATGSGGGLYRFLIKLLRDLLIGLGIVVAVLFIQDRGFFRTNTDDAAADELMPFHVGVVQENKPAYPFALIAIDEQTYRDWKEPLITPRNELAKIIKFARRGEAKLIFLDIELSRLGNGTLSTRIPRDKQATTCGKLGEADAELCQVVKQTGSIPIILARTIVARPDSRPGEERWEARPSFLDPILGDVPNQAAPRVHWASPLYSLDSDRFIRRSRLWELVCENSELKAENSELKAVPSVELLALALLPEPDETSKLAERMKSIPPGNCVDRATKLDLPEPLKLHGRAIEIDITPKSPRDRILYSIDWSGEQSRLYADQRGREHRPQVTIPNTNRKADLVTTISARTISDSVDPSVVKDHIVVIGATHREAGDLHETPLGVMPGSLIIINAIHSLQQYGQLSEPSVWQKGILAAVVMTICVFAYHVLWAELVSFVFPFVSFILAFYLNILFVHKGIWIDAALPALIYLIFSFFYARAIELRERAAAERRKHPHSRWPAWLWALLNERTFDRDRNRG